MELHLKTIGVVLVLLACVHIIFPRYFDWKADLAPLSLINRQMMHVHTLFIAVAVLLMGLLCVTSAREICTTPLGRKIAFGMGCFWVLRLIIQFVGYSPKLWRGKRFETAAHICFALFWAYVSVVFLVIACR